ncbi:MAG: hypothetical protein A2138_23730 [Deltaproteobacteria bacterium RBG_16_71_12]|nr:MAG: hypothetical protein A2138_23730 [Deltaproteobacteria bacterium RBG_16_71_12]
MLRLRDELTAKLLEQRVLRLLRGAPTAAGGAEAEELVPSFERVVRSLREHSKCAAPPDLRAPAAPTSMVLRRFARVSSGRAAEPR